MRWIDVKNLDELKSLGKFMSVKKEISNDVGENIKITGRSWKDLFNNIIKFKEVVQKINISNINTSNNEDTNKYFTSKANEYIFYLTELDGEIRMKKLGITKSHFSNKNKAKKWRDTISKEIHPDINNHPKSNIAMSKLNDMYSSMIGRS